MAQQKPLKIDARRAAILDVLQRDGQVRVSQLSELFDATVVTIRTDLEALERDGYLQRVPGGAVQTVKNYYSLDYMNRKRENAELKQAVGRAAAALVNDGETLLINSGVTTHFVAMALKAKKGLSVVTNSIAVAMELGAHAGFRVILLGGEINAQYSFTYGSDALEQARHYKADKAILSIDGVAVPEGLTTYHAEEAVIDRIMMERARGTIVAADRTKLGRESFSQVCALEQVHTLVTNTGADAALLEKIRAAGPSVVLTE